MIKNKKSLVKEANLEVRLKSIERDCPRCKALLVLNDNEQCYECHNCGYIDCGDDEQS